MRSAPRAQVAIVDYGMGNLFSVRQACRSVGLEAVITADPQAVAAADGVILPGIGAFGDAMATLHRRGLVGVLRDVALSGKPFFGICLGMQMLMRESFEFGRHEGLGLVEGEVVRLQDARGQGRTLKVPQVGWNRVQASGGGRPGASPESWRGTPLEGQHDGVYMYFVHSFYARPADSAAVVAETQYGPIAFCAALRRGSIFACQFHPERSGPQGLRVYARFAASIPVGSGGMA